jgi:hypothetical protein
MLIFLQTDTTFPSMFRRLRQASAFSSTISWDYHMDELLARLCHRDDAAMSAGALNLLGGHRHGADPLSSEGNLGFGLLDRTVAVCGII